MMIPCVLKIQAQANTGGGKGATGHRRGRDVWAKERNVHIINHSTLNATAQRK